MRDNAEAGLKTTEKQFKDIRKQLHYNEINLATKKQLVMELCEELRKAKEAIQPVKEVAEAEKQVAYTLGVKETQARLTEEFSVVCKDYFGKPGKLSNSLRRQPRPRSRLLTHLG